MRHRGDSRSERAAALLRGSGYDAQALEGGFPAWEHAGYPVDRDGADVESEVSKRFWQP